MWEIKYTYSDFRCSSSEFNIIKCKGVVCVSQTHRILRGRKKQKNPVKHDKSPITCRLISCGLSVFYFWLFILIYKTPSSAIIYIIQFEMFLCCNLWGRHLSFETRYFYVFSAKSSKGRRTIFSSVHQGTGTFKFSCTLYMCKQKQVFIQYLYNIANFIEQNC